MTPLLRPVWCVASSRSFSKTTTLQSGRRLSSSVAVASPRMPPPTTTASKRSSAATSRRCSGGCSSGDALLGEQELRDLNRVECRALAQVVADDEEREAVLDRRVLADPPDEDVVAAGRDPRRGELLEADPRCPAEDRRRLLGRERLVRLDPDRLGVPDEHRHSHAGGAHRQHGQLEDLPRLLAQLLLLVELDAVELPGHPQVVLLLGLGA